MPDFTMDWTAVNIDGANTVSSGAGSIGVTISSPTNGDGDEFAATTIAGAPAIGSSSVNNPTEISAEFDAPVENVVFEVFDVDSGSGWDDRITIIALDADGNQVPVTFTNTYLHTIDGNSIEGAGADNGGVEGSGALDTVTVNIAGPIVSLTIIHDDGDSSTSSGTIGLGELTFDAAVIENEGPVDGEAFGETMVLGYNDADGPTDGGGDIITDSGDTIFGNGGDDTIDGAGGDDTIYGDDGTGGGDIPGTSEVFEWSEAPGFGDNLDASGFTQNTGTVNVTFSILSEGGSAQTQFETDQQNIDLLDPATNDNSSLYSVTNGDAGSASYELEMDREVENVQFRINDIDGDGRVYVVATDADGNDVIVELTDAGSGITLSDTDGVAGNDTASSNGGYAEDTSDTYSMLVTIPGPVSNIRIFHEQDGANNSGVNITDVAFDAPADLGDAGNDEIAGGAGDDLIFGEAGDDTLDGGEGIDTLSGGAGRDVLIGGVGDVADGGTTGDDFDTLDLRGLGRAVVINETVDADGDSTSGTINFLDADGNVTGSMEFTEIEEILRDEISGPVDGLDSGEFMGPGYTDAQLDMIDGSDGINDTIFGNGGDDVIDAGLGDDTVDGGEGDDTFQLNDAGGGLDNDVITGGETGETDGDLLDASDQTADLTLDLSTGDPEDGTLTDGTDTVVFEEIERFTLGSGDDTAIGSEGDDYIFTGEGDDSVTVGDGSDFIDGGNGNNVIDTSGGGTDPLPDIGYPGLFDADADPDNDRDFVLTGTGNDSITTGDDADTINSGAGDDTIDSGFDADSIAGGAGNDLITSGEGSDFVLAGSGDDTIYGGLGPSAPDSLNIPDDGSGPFGPDLAPDNGMDTIDGGSGNDLIFGEDDDDSLRGGSGNDTIDGGIDDDTIAGGTGDDIIIGGQGVDVLDGGDDSDTFIIGSASDAIGDTIDGGTGGAVDYDTLDLTGLGRVDIVNQTVDADGDSTSGEANFYDADGNLTGTLTFSEIENLVICFTPTSRIATPRGEVMVGDLQAGDRVITRDDGVQEIQWIGRKKLTTADLIEDPQLRPVLIRQGSLGNNLPERDMMVSPNHRMLVANSQTHMLFDEREVLVAAKHLVGQPGIQQVDTLGTEYVHVMFDRHEVILGDGTWTESFQPGDHSLGGIEGEQRAEIFKLFPSLQKAEGRRSYAAARQSLKAHEARMLRESMAAN